MYSAPEYKLLISSIGGERRFCSAVAKRLQALGALTQGDRHAATGAADMRDFDLDSAFGITALMRFYSMIFSSGKRNLDMDSIVVPRGMEDPSAASMRVFFGECKLMLATMGIVTRGQEKVTDKNASNLNLFLNRLFLLDLKRQHILFGYFEKVFESVKEEAIKGGDLDPG